MPPKYVKRDKNDWKDAEACAEACQRLVHQLRALRLKRGIAGPAQAGGKAARDPGGSGERAVAAEARLGRGTAGRRVGAGAEGRGVRRGTGGVPAAAGGARQRRADGHGDRGGERRRAGLPGQARLCGRAGPDVARAVDRRPAAAGPQQQARQQVRAHAAGALRAGGLGAALGAFRCPGRLATAAERGAAGPDRRRNPIPQFVASPDRWATVPPASWKPAPSNGPSRSPALRGPRRVEPIVASTPRVPLSGRIYSRRPLHPIEPVPHLQTRGRTICSIGASRCSVNDWRLVFSCDWWRQVENPFVTSPLWARQEEQLTDYFSVRLRQCVSVCWATVRRTNGSSLLGRQPFSKAASRAMNPGR